MPPLCAWSAMFFVLDGKHADEVDRPFRVRCPQYLHCGYLITPNNAAFGIE